MEQIVNLIAGAFYDSLPLVPFGVAIVWTLRFQRIADLSLAGSFAIAAAVTAQLASTGYGIIWCVVAGILIAIITGSMMAFSVNLLKIDSLLSGLVVLFIVYAISLGITEGSITIPNNNNPLQYIINIEKQNGMKLQYHLLLSLFFFVIALIVVIMSNRLLSSEWGCAYRALEDEIGGRAFIQSIGVSPNQLSFIGFVAAATLSSISGILIAYRDFMATSSIGITYLIEIIPAYLLGIYLFEEKPILRKSIIDKILSRLRAFQPSSAAGIGVILYFVIINIAQFLAESSWLPRVLIGMTLLVLLGINQIISNHNRSKRQKENTKYTSEDDNFCITGLSVSYASSEGNNIVLEGVGLTSPPGHVVLIKGPNGCGKTTLLRALADRIDCNGKFIIPVSEKNLSVENRIQVCAYVPQAASENVASRLSVLEHAVLALKGKNLSVVRNWKKTGTQAYKMLRMGDVLRDPTALAKWLSGGQKRRLLLELILLRKDKPILIALDEPFSHLDAKGQVDCNEIINELQRDGRIVLIVDHHNIYENKGDEAIVSQFNMEFCSISKK